MKTKTLRDRLDEIKEIYGWGTVIDEMCYMLEEAHQTARAQGKVYLASKLFILFHGLSKALKDSQKEE